ncbi:MAG TPA: rRNA maturation RNase YbeY [Vulgatibacter sp.]
MHLTIEVEGGAYAGRVLRARAREFMAKLGKGKAELSILLTTDGGIRTLNRRFRGKNAPTDVLSFPAGDEGPLPPGMPRPLGDLAISLDTARRRAIEDGRSLSFELSRYLAHGLLHLLDYDHERSEAEARRMARAESRLLGLPGMLADAQGVSGGGGRSGARRGPMAIGRGGPDAMQRAPRRVEGRPAPAAPSNRRS